MKLTKYLYLLPIFAFVFYGCENVSEPISIEEGAQPAFVTITTESQQVAAGGSLSVQFQLGQTQEEDVTVEYAISGGAEEGTDYTISSGGAGNLVIEYDPESTALDNNSVLLSFPIDAAFGTTKELTFTLISATTASGESLNVGRGEIGAERTYTIAGLGEATVGTYDFEATTSFGDFTGELEITQPDSPIIVDGNPYLYVTSKITANAGDIFGINVPYAFNVTAGGDIIGAPNAHGAGLETIILDVGGTYDDATNEIFFDVTFQCCGAEGAQVLKTAVLQ